MRKNILLLHIGMVKTGTTALQNYLYQNSEKLQVNGWSYPAINNELAKEGIDFKNVDFKNGSIFNASWVVKNEELSKISLHDWKELWDIENSFEVDSNCVAWEKTWSLIKRHLRKTNVIISEELISWRNTASFLEAAREQYDNIKVLIYLRRQDRFLESVWNQSVKYSLVSEKLDVERIELEKFNYYALLEGIASIVGRDNLIVRVYEKEQLVQNDIVSDFYDAIGIRFEQCQKRTKSNFNVGLTGNLLEIKRSFNSSIDRCLYNKENMREFFDIGRKDINNHIYEVEGYMTKEQRRMILEYYSETNKRVAREYFHRQKGELFLDASTDIKLGQIETGTMYDDVVCIFTRIVSDLYMKYEEENKKRISVTVKMILHMNAKKKLYLWGAGKTCRDIMNRYDIPVEAIIDNYVTDNSEINGIRIISPKNVNCWDDGFVIISCCYEKEISKQLENMGLVRFKDYISYMELF